jgi:hypothetical protein
MAQHVDEQIVVLGRQVAGGLLVQRVQHVDKFARRFRIDHGLTGARIRIAAQHHGRVTAQHAYQIFKRRRALRHLRGRNCGHGLRSGPRGSRHLRHRALRFELRFARFLLHHFRTQLACGGKRAAVDYAETFILLVFVLFVVRQGTFLSFLAMVKFSMGDNFRRVRPV